MSLKAENLSLTERFEHIFAVLSSPRFLKKQGLGNEVPFFICPYKIQEAILFEQRKKKLIKSLQEKKICILEVHLYDLSIEIIKERGVFEQILELEPTIEKEQLKELLQNILDS